MAQSRERTKKRTLGALLLLSEILTAPIISVPTSLTACARGVLLRRRAAEDVSAESVDNTTAADKSHDHYVSDVLSPAELAEFLEMSDDKEVVQPSTTRAEALPSCMLSVRVEPASTASPSESLTQILPAPKLIEVVSTKNLFEDAFFQPFRLEVVQQGTDAILVRVVRDVEAKSTTTGESSVSTTGEDNNTNSRCGQGQHPLPGVSAVTPQRRTLGRRFWMRRVVNESSVSMRARSYIEKKKEHAGAVI